MLHYFKIIHVLCCNVSHHTHTHTHTLTHIYKHTHQQPRYELISGFHRAFLKSITFIGRLMHLIV